MQIKKDSGISLSSGVLENIGAEFTPSLEKIIISQPTIWTSKRYSNENQLKELIVPLKLDGFRSAQWNFMYFEFVILEIRIQKRSEIGKEMCRWFILQKIINNTEISM